MRQTRRRTGYGKGRPYENASARSLCVRAAKQVKADDKTVAKVRRELESRSDIPNIETRTDSKGRNRPSRKPERDKQPSTPPPHDGAEASANARKAHYGAPAPAQTAEPQASDAANKRILKSKVTKGELLRMLQPILALAFKDDVASISDGDAALYDALESAKGVIDGLQTVLRLHQNKDRRKADATAPLIPDDLSIPEFLRRGPEQQAAPIGKPVSVRITDAITKQEPTGRPQEPISADGTSEAPKAALGRGADGHVLTTSVAT
jgi:hypothetical protein